MLGRGMPKITLVITGLHDILGRDYGIEDPLYNTSFMNKQTTTTNSPPIFPSLCPELTVLLFYLSSVNHYCLGFLQKEFYETTVVSKFFKTILKFWPFRCLY